MARAVIAHKPELVLDVGAGRGELITLLRKKHIIAYGIDLDNAAENVFYGDARSIPYPDNTFDVVVSNDFFEHIKESDIGKVYSEMKRVSKGAVIARISIKPQKGHLTVKPISWWKEKLPGCQFIGKAWQ